MTRQLVELHGCRFLIPTAPCNLNVIKKGLMHAYRFLVTLRKELAFLVMNDSVSLTRARTRTNRTRVERTNYESTASATKTNNELSSKRYWLRIPEWYLVALTRRLTLPTFKYNFFNDLFQVWIRFEPNFLQRDHSLCAWNKNRRTLISLYA